jgi:hypothetical protein
MTYATVENVEQNEGANPSAKQSSSGDEDREKSWAPAREIGAIDGVDEHPPLTLKRLLALFSLTLLFMTAAVPVYFITATLGTRP